jgi:hypothetical protein
MCRCILVFPEGSRHSNVGQGATFWLDFSMIGFLSRLVLAVVGSMHAVASLAVVVFPSDLLGAHYCRCWRA